MIINCDFRKITLEVTQCLECARRDPPCPFTFGILKLMYREFQPQKDSIRVTELTHCPRQVILKRIIPEITVKPQDLWWLARGTALHAAIANAQIDEESILSEKFLIKKFNDIPLQLTGTCDEFDVNSQILIDYKTTQEIPRYNPFNEHVLQINLYKYLLENNDEQRYNVKKMYIIYTDMKSVKKFLIEVIPDIEQMIRKSLKRFSKFLIKNENIIKSEFEIGWQCNYCPQEIYLKCRSMIFLKIAKKIKKMNVHQIEEYLKSENIPRA